MTIKFTKEMEEAVAVVRSLLLIRKNITSIREMVQDYRNMEDEDLPFKKFGFKSVEEFLRHSNEFNISSSSGQVS